ncbi:MAG: hypothetical protein EAX96_05855 [Candidatus Lokiarchaeota archaeon]|nr:hypothetical protein [Candidatus Lokiarchaeota archaeon]
MGDRIKTGIRFLDFFLSGGFQVPGFIHLYGEPGTGKSTLGYHLVSRLHEQGEKAVWLDFNHSFSIKRLISMAKDSSIVRSVALLAMSAHGQFINTLSKLNTLMVQARLLVLDNFTYFYQLSETQEKKGTFYTMFHHQLIRILALLRRQRALGLLINQVRSTLDGTFYPIGGQLINELSRYVLTIKKSGQQYELEIIKGEPNQILIPFILKNDGWRVLEHGVKS